MIQLPIQKNHIHNEETYNKPKQYAYSFLHCRHGSYVLVTKSYEFGVDSFIHLGVWHCEAKWVVLVKDSICIRLCRRLMLE